MWHPFGLLHSPFCFATTISCLQVLEQQCPTCEPPAAQFKLSLLCVSNVMTTAPYMATFLDILMSMGIVFPIMTTFPLTFWCNEPLCYFFTSALRIEEIHVSTDWVQQNRFLFSDFYHCRSIGTELISSTLVASALNLPLALNQR